ncbi:MAG: metal-sulfur cluster assembly factor [candidate division WOR-3 bacterium]
MSKGSRITARVVATLGLAVLGLLVMSLPVLLRRQRPVLTLQQLTTFTDSTPAQPGVVAPGSSALRSALARVMDPELDLSIVELGLVESLAVDTAGNTRVVMVLTTPECPFGPLLAQQALQELKTVPGIRRIEVRLDPSVEWRPEQMTDEAKRRFRQAFGNDTRSRP